MRSSKISTALVSHLPRPIAEEWTWQQRGHCLNLPSEVFFPDSLPRASRRAKEERAKRICRDCPVLAECREHALRTPEPYGIWGAMTPRERAGSKAEHQGGSAVGR